MTRLSVIVPAYQEEASIASVVRETLTAAPGADVVVVDDGSDDVTAERARAAGARVVALPFNCGIGAAVQTGLEAALEGPAEIFARLDGDGQHDPAGLARLVGRLEAGQCDFALGSRFLTGEGFQTSPLRRLGSRWFARLLRLRGVRVTDPTSGFWAATRPAAEVLHASYASDYPEVDALVHLAHRGLRIAEEPVVMRARETGRSSIDAPAAVYYMIKVTVALAMARSELPEPREPAIHSKR